MAATAGRWPNWGLMALFGVGAMVMRGAGCTLNDIIDRDFDARVARTRTRPIASGAVSVKQALMFLAALLAIGAVILLSMNRAAILLGVSVLVLIATYPLMKRVTYWPQFFLGLNFNWGALLGWAAATGSLAAPAYLLYAGGIAWTLGYDTIYAHQDKKDDAIIGIKSSALRLQENTRPVVEIFYVLAMIGWAWAAALSSVHMFAYGFLTMAFFHLIWQIKTVDLDLPEACRRIFISNVWLGWLVFFAFLIGKV